LYNHSTENKLTFLIDKVNSDDFKIRDEIINIQGIGQRVIKSQGTTSIELQSTKYIIPHEFYLVDSNYSLPCDGIIGIDFIKKINCQLDFKQKQNYYNWHPTSGLPTRIITSKHSKLLFQRALNI